MVKYFDPSWKISKATEILLKNLFNNKVENLVQIYHSLDFNNESIEKLNEISKFRLLKDLLA